MIHVLKQSVIWSLVAMIVWGFAVTAPFGQTVTAPTGDLAKIDIVEHLGSKIPLDLRFTNENGQPVTLRDYLGHDKPVLLMLGYYGCPMLCNLVFNGVADGVRPMQWTPGREFQMVTVSFNPNETYQLAYAKKQNYLKYLNRPGVNSGWAFLVGEASQSEALTQAIGFKFIYDSTSKQYGHAAAIYVLADDGTISRYLYGIEFPSKDLKFALLEASQGKIGSTVDRILMYCYHYDPASKGYVLFAQNVMKLGGGITLLLVAGLLAVLWMRERATGRKRRLLAGQTPSGRA